jgi:hypothetical protein
MIFAVIYALFSSPVDGPVDATHQNTPETMQTRTLDKQTADGVGKGAAGRFENCPGGVYPNRIFPKIPYPPFDLA